jgi:hypothetical protein
MLTMETMSWREARHNGRPFRAPEAGKATPFKVTN